MAGVPARRWCFTINNPDETIALTLGECITYCVWQLEEGENGTRHFQGYCELDRPQRFSYFRKLDPNWFKGHFEKAKGSAEQCKLYCTKDDSRVAGPWEQGAISSGQGSRNDLKVAVVEFGEHKSLKRLAEEHGSVYVKFWKGFEKLAETTREIERMHLVPNEWQARVLDIATGPVDDRDIWWIVDFAGGTGKSMLVEFIARNLGGLPLGPGQSRQIKEAYHGERVVTFDFPRATKAADHDFVPYDGLETIKNGIVFSGMYGAVPRIYPRPHVICFSNFEPDATKFSADRLQLMYL